MQPRRVSRGLSRLLLGAYFLLAAAANGIHAQSLPGAEQQPEREEQPTGTIEAEAESLPADAEIEARLEGIFANLPSLRQVSVAVHDGVIVLGGTVQDTDSRDQAYELARRVAGAVVVVNDIERDRSVATRLAAAMASIESELKDLAGSLPVILLALIVVAAGVLLARLVGKVERPYARIADNWFVRDLLRQLTQLALFFAALVIALKLLDATALLGSVVGALGIIGLAIGFATRETVENYIASILLSIRQPFQREDQIEVNGVEGKVLRLTSRATVLMSLEGNHIRIPNSTVFKSTIVNYTRNPLRRFSFGVGVDTGIDLAEPRLLAVEALERLEGVLAEPKPQCLIERLGDSSVVLQVQGWIDQRNADFAKVRSEAQRVVKEAFDEAGIVMPEPIYNVNLRRGAAAGIKERATPTQPVPPEVADEVHDTEPDRAIEEQMRAEQEVAGDEDLLRQSAPQE